MAAARVGYVFGMDPVAVLDERDTVRRQIRDAAWSVWANDQRLMMGGDNDG
jgi:hypothetical protein